MFDFLPEKYRKRAFIAGGWAACPALAGDRDVWVQLDSNSSAYEQLTELQNYLQNRAIFYEVADRTRVIDYPTNSTIKVADLVYPWEKVQVLATHLTPEQLIEDFDISTHQIAITADGRVIKGSHWTPTTEPPQFIPGKKRSTSDERMDKICRRFNQYPKMAFWRTMWEGYVRRFFDE